MKVIELLNKIANGEEVPKEIKYRDAEYIFNSDIGYYIPDLGEQLFTKLFINDEVEIIEEDKKIEKIHWKSCADNLKEVNGNIDELSKKINEIIDYLEENK